MKDKSQFSEREKEVTELLLQGKSNKQIAMSLGISASTVEYHLKNIYKKLQVNSRTEAVLVLGKSTGGDITSTFGKSTVEMNGETADNGVQPISTRRIPMNKMFVMIGIGLLAIALVVVFVLFVNKPVQSAEVAPTVPALLTSTPTFTPTLTQADFSTAAPTTSIMYDTCPVVETTYLKLFIKADDGYCFLYPAEDTPNPPAIIIINPNGLPGDMPGDAWVQITTEEAAGRTAEQVADQQIAEAGTGFNITRNEIVIDGKQAIVVDGLPGQDAERKVFIVANDHLYTLFFTPWAPNENGFLQLEKLYSTVINTLHFFPLAP